MAYVVNGSEIVANTTTADAQSFPSVTGLNGGGFVVTWQDASQTGGDTSALAVRGQVFLANGTKSGSEFLVNTTTTSDQQAASIAALSGGGFVITWQDSSASGGDTADTAVRGQLFLADGTKSGSEFLVNTTTADNQRLPSVAGLSGGGFVVAWQDNSASGGDTSDAAVRAQIYLANGTASGSEFLVNTTTTGDQAYPQVAGLSGGGFVVTWHDYSASGGDTSDSAVRGQVYQADGTRSGSEFLVNTSTSREQTNPKITGLSNGGFVVVWTDDSRTGGDTSQTAVRGQVFLADGTKSGSEFLVNTTTTNSQNEASIVALSNGGFVVTWTDNSLTGGDTSSSAVRGQIFLADGTKSGSEFLVNTATAQNQYTSSVGALNSGGFVVAWTDESQSAGDTSDLAVRVQLYSFVAANCYLAGSLVQTAQGDRPVEALRIGDPVLTASGRYRPIRWIGVTTIPARLLGTAEARRDCLPLIVRKDAVHENVPSQDLYIAPLHSMVANGVAMPLSCLANRLSILQDAEIRDLVYYNVELDTVDTIFVNRLPVLSLHPRLSPRYRFDNCDDYFARYPDGAEHDRALTAPVPEATRKDLEPAAFWLYDRAKRLHPKAAPVMVDA